MLAGKTTPLVLCLKKYKEKRKKDPDHGPDGEAAVTLRTGSGKLTARGDRSLHTGPVSLMSVCRSGDQLSLGFFPPKYASS